MSTGYRQNHRRMSHRMCGHIDSKAKHANHIETIATIDRKDSVEWADRNNCWVFGGI